MVRERSAISLACSGKAFPPPVVLFQTNRTFDINLILGTTLLLRYFKSYGMFVKFGHQSDRSDWVHVDNVVHACVLALGKLQVAECEGEAFFIGDNEPCNTIDFCEPLAQMVGVPYVGWLWIPYHVMWAVGWAVEIFCSVYHAGTGRDIEPLLTRAEVDKVARTHFWRTERAQHLLGYKPIVTRRDGQARMYAHFQAQLQKEGYPRKGTNAVLLIIAVTLAFFYALLTFRL